MTTLADKIKALQIDPSDADQLPGTDYAAGFADARSEAFILARNDVSARLLADIDARLSEVQPGMDHGYTYRGHWLGMVRGTWTVQQSGRTVENATSLIVALATIDLRIAVANQRARHAARVQDAAAMIGGAA